MPIIGGAVGTMEALEVDEVEVDDVDLVLALVELIVPLLVDVTVMLEDETVDVLCDALENDVVDKAELVGTAKLVDVKLLEGELVDAAELVGVVDDEASGEAELLGVATALVEEFKVEDAVELSADSGPATVLPTLVAELVNAVENVFEEAGDDMSLAPSTPPFCIACPTLFLR